MSSLDGDKPCQDCGTTENIIWFTDDELWNAVCGPPDYEVCPILCIHCFVARVEARGYSPLAWRLRPVWS